MNIALIVTFAVLFFILLITYPFKIKVAVHINFLKDIGFLAIKLMQTKLFCGRFTITKSGKFEVKNAVKKKKKKKNKEIKRAYIKCLASMIILRKFEFFLDAGHESNAHFVSMVCGYVSAFVSSLLAPLLNRFEGLKAFTRVNPSFTENRLEVSGSIVLSFTLLSVIISLVCAYCCYFKNRLKEKFNG